MDGNRSSLWVLFLVCLVAFSANKIEAQSENQNSTVSYYVAPNGSDSNPGTQEQPLASLQAVQEKVRKLVADGLKSNVMVIIRAGVYELTEPLAFGPADSGNTKYSITYSAYPRESVVISGGRRITGWKEMKPDLWSATIDKKCNLEQLYVNNKRAIHARTPNTDSTPPRWNLAKADYKIVHGSRCAFVGPAPHVLQDRLPGKHPARR